MKKSLCMLAISVLLATTSGMGGCSSDNATNAAADGGAEGGGSPVGPTVEITIGPEGGVASSDDGLLSITFPAGAVAAPTKIMIQRTNGTMTRLVGTLYELLPHGTTFASPIALFLKYTPPADSADGNNPQAVTLGWAPEGGTELTPLTPGGYDPVKGGVYGTMDHFSFAAVATLGCGPGGACPSPLHCIPNWGCGIPCRSHDDCPVNLECSPNVKQDVTCDPAVGGDHCVLTVSYGATSVCQGKECSSDASCNRPDNRCDKSLYVCAKPCTTSSDCGVDYLSCVQHTCVYQSCTSNDSCPTGQSCDGVCWPNPAGCGCGGTGTGCECIKPNSTCGPTVVCGAGRTCNCPAGCTCACVTTPAYPNGACRACGHIDEVCCAGDQCFEGKCNGKGADNGGLVFCR